MRGEFNATVQAQVDGLTTAPLAGPTSSARTATTTSTGTTRTGTSTTGTSTSTTTAGATGANGASHIMASGAVAGVAGVDVVYEAPERADLTVDVTTQSIPEIVHSTCRCFTLVCALV